MNITSYTSDVTSRMSAISPLSIPQTLWAYYLEYLWFYAPDSWVAKIANASLALAILVSLPIVILGLLDITSYGIARTLGVIDDVKASTSDKATIHTSRCTPAIHVHAAAAAAASDTDSTFSASDSDRDACAAGPHVHTHRGAHPLSAEAARPPSQPPLFYVGEDNSKLSGVGVFSPAASQPPSPTISRYNLAVLHEGGGEQLRLRTHHHPEHGEAQ